MIVYMENNFARQHAIVKGSGIGALLQQNDDDFVLKLGTTNKVSTFREDLCTGLTYTVKHGNYNYSITNSHFSFQQEIHSS